jgi:hypothetical protein
MVLNHIVRIGMEGSMLIGDVKVNTDRIGSSFEEFLKDNGTLEEVQRACKDMVEKQEKLHRRKDMNTATISIEEYDELRKIRDNLEALKKEVDDGRDLIKVEEGARRNYDGCILYNKQVTYIGKDEAIKLLEADHNEKLKQSQDRIIKLENDLRMIVEKEKTKISTASFFKRLKYLFTRSLD